jgi:hypothetical protein
MDELIKGIVSPPAGEGKELEFGELTALLRRKIRVLHGGASALFATSTSDLMAEAKKTTENLLLEVENAERAAAGLKKRKSEN